MLCNDVRGTLYLDDQYVSCFCADCEARVRAGHDRPIFGLRWVGGRACQAALLAAAPTPACRLRLGTLGAEEGTKGDALSAVEPPEQ